MKSISTIGSPQNIANKTLEQMMESRDDPMRNCAAPRGIPSRRCTAQSERSKSRSSHCTDLASRKLSRILPRTFRTRSSARPSPRSSGANAASKRLVRARFPGALAARDRPLCAALRADGVGGRGRARRRRRGGAGEAPLHRRAVQLMRGARVDAPRGGGRGGQRPRAAPDYAVQQRRAADRVYGRAELTPSLRTACASSPHSANKPCPHRDRESSQGKVGWGIGSAGEIKAISLN
jgi:hypothetical protein